MSDYIYEVKSGNTTVGWYPGNKHEGQAHYAKVRSSGYLYELNTKSGRKILLDRKE